MTKTSIHLLNNKRQMEVWKKINIKIWYKDHWHEKEVGVQPREVGKFPRNSWPSLDPYKRTSWKRLHLGRGLDRVGKLSMKFRLYGESSQKFSMVWERIRTKMRRPNKRSVTLILPSHCSLWIRQWKKKLFQLQAPSIPLWPGNCREQ